MTTSTVSITTGISDIDSTWNDHITDNLTITTSSLTGTIDTISPTYTLSDDQLSFNYDNINIVPTLWTETLPDVYTVNDMCKEYPALAKAYENFQTVYKLVEQDYKGKKEDKDL